MAYYEKKVTWPRTGNEHFLEADLTLEDKFEKLNYYLQKALGVSGMLLEREQSVTQ